MEAYTDELIFSFQNAFPNQTFEKMSINWKIPAIDEESLYSASYWCERVDGVLTKVSANGKIYSGKVGFIDNSGSENDDVTKSSGFFDTIKKGSSKNLSTKNDIAYDATLEYSTKGPVVFSSETAMARFMKAVANDYEGTIEEMLNSGEAMVITNGTKCSILKTTISKCQVKLLEGSHAGETVWTVIEALKRK